MGSTHFRRRRLAPLVAALALTSTPALAADEPSTDTTPIVVRVDGGFSWTDAGIGVVAGAGVALVVVGGAALMRATPQDGPDEREQTTRAFSAVGPDQEPIKRRQQ
jgi:hypothetical protein